MVEDIHRDGTGGPLWEEECIARLKFQLFNMLAPFNPHDPATGKALYSDLNADSVRDPKNLTKDPLYDRLITIVLAAVQIHKNIRQSGDRIYYWDPLYKGTEFEPPYMTCANFAPVQNSSPFNVNFDKNGKKIQENDSHPSLDYSIKALVRIVCFHGLTVYREGGGELADHTLEVEKQPGYFEEGGAGFDPWRRKPISKDPAEKDVRTRKDGFRSRIMAKGIVALTWGKERKMLPFSAMGKEPVKDGAPREDGYVELLDIARNEVMEMQKEGKGDGGCVMS